MADTEQRGQPDTDELNALRARVDYAESLVDWVNQAPEPPETQTAAKTLNEVLGEIVGELARIRACYDLKGARDFLNDHAPDKVYKPDQEYRDWWEETSKEVDDKSKANMCPGAQ
jgi:hypothetical protein